MEQVLRDPIFQRRLLWLNGALPAVMLAFDLLTNRLGANPPEAIIRTTGVVAILFLTLSLAITPIAQIFKWHSLIRHRRWLGLWCFNYALVHMIAYSIFDKGLVFSEVWVDLQKRPFILLGFAGFLLLIPLAVTSTNEMIQRMGIKSWKRLHKFVYLIAVLTAVHFWLIVKSDIFYPAIFAVTLASLLLYRIVKRAKA